MKFKKILVLLIVPLTASVLVLAPVAVAPAAAAGAFTQGACEGLHDIDTSHDCSTNPGRSIDGILKNIINLLSVIVGIAAVIVILIAGMRFVTSGGSTEDTASAKSAIIYAIVGLIVVALAQAIVHFVLGQVT